VSSSAAIRDALRELPSLAMSSTGQPPLADEIYFPENHAEALDPDVSLVIGNRGMGKTFWSLALSDDSLRPEIARRYFAARRVELTGLHVSLGYLDPDGIRGLVSKPELESVDSSVPAEVIWRSVILRRLAKIANWDIPSSFRTLVSWVRSEPEAQLRIFRVADEALVNEGIKEVFVFDQLDRLADDWVRIQTLTKGLLRVALAMKSYRAIKTKLFMRPDQAENKQLFQFPDASKILGGSRLLTWRVTDLYGLLFHEIHRNSQAVSTFRTICSTVGVNPRKMHDRLDIPAGLVGNPEAQGAIFDAIAGQFMGRGSKRGRPYTWIPTHLADGRGEISPRTFLKVMKVAAEWADPPPSETAIDFHGIQEGVRQASTARLAELEEDYPWVSMALEPLRGLLVPCESVEITARWIAAGTVGNITQTHLGSLAPIDLVVANLVSPDEEAAVLLSLLRDIGVVEERANGKINVPDIFRVRAGILRKGGVTPQQRRRL
jgi:hypothetical protein